jgi:hypothetical protein
MPTQRLSMRRIRHLLTMHRRGQQTLGHDGVDAPDRLPEQGVAPVHDHHQTRIGGADGPDERNRSVTASSGSSSAARVKFAIARVWREARLGPVCPGPAGAGRHRLARDVGGGFGQRPGAGVGRVAIFVFFGMGRPVPGIVCCVLQASLLGWAPAALWAVRAERHLAAKHHGLAARLRPL